MIHYRVDPRSDGKKQIVLSGNKQLNYQEFQDVIKKEFSHIIDQKNIIIIPTEICNVYISEK